MQTKIVDMPKHLKARKTMALELLELPQGKALAVDCRDVIDANVKQGTARYSNKELRKHGLKVSCARVPNGGGVTLYIWTEKVK